MEFIKENKKVKKKENKISTKKKRNNDNGQEKKKKKTLSTRKVGFKEKTITIKKKEGRKLKTQIRMKH